jgi:hypothetical protein
VRWQAGGEPLNVFKRRKTSSRSICLLFR